MENNKILIISGLQIFPPTSGGQIRTASIASALHSLGNEVTIYSFTGRKANYINRRKSLNQNTTGISEHTNMNSILGILQFISYKIKLPPIWLYLVTMVYRPRLLKDLMEETSLIIIDFPFLANASKLKDKTVLNTHNIEADLWVNPVIKKIVNFIEKRAVERSSKVMFCTQEDCSKMVANFGIEKAKTIIVPNGVYLPAAKNFNRESFREKLGVKKDNRLIVFSGSSYGPNIEAFKLLKNFIKNHSTKLKQLKITFLVVGTVSPKPSKDNELIVTSFVEDIIPYLLSADLAINFTIRGSGSNIKMSEYIELDLPILTTTFGAIGLNLTNEHNSLYFNKDNLIQIIEKLDSYNLKDLATQAKQDNDINGNVTNGLKHLTGER